MRHVVQTSEQDYPITLTVHEGSLANVACVDDVVFIDTGGYEDIEVAITAIPAFIDALQAVYKEFATEEEV